MASGMRRLRRTARGASRRRRGRTAAPMPRAMRQMLVCAALFVVLTGLKLALPGHMETARETLGQWLVRDADFAAAFSAVGQVFSGEKAADESLDEAYTAVFGAADTLQPELPANAVEGERALAIEFSPPLAEGTLTSGFGWREDPLSGAQAFHWGVDLAAQEGTQILCFADGTVSTVGESTVLGKYLTVMHGDGIETLYAHCSAVLAASGAQVKRGEAVALVGATGNATGAHLHFEVHDGADHLDPAQYVAAQ